MAKDRPIRRTPSFYKHAPLDAFLSACCVFDEGASVPKDELFKAYQDWARSERQTVYTKGAFGRFLLGGKYTVSSTRFVHPSGRRVQFYAGLRLQWWV
jgi:hypothetical protein